MIRFTLNGAAASLAADQSLLAALREDIAATGTKRGCDIGRCGACTVLLDGRAVNACLLLGWQVEDRAVTTIEAIETLPAGRALVTAMEEENGFQCGYCAPGVVMSLAGLLSARPDAGEAELLEALEGNICRCSGYHSILRGARRACALLKEDP